MNITYGSESIFRRVNRPFVCRGLWNDYYIISFKYTWDGKRFMDEDAWLLRIHHRLRRSRIRSRFPLSRSLSSPCFPYDFSPFFFYCDPSFCLFAIRPSIKEKGTLHIMVGQFVDRIFIRFYEVKLANSPLWKTMLSIRVCLSRFRSGRWKHLGIKPTVCSNRRISQRILARAAKVKRIA